MAGRGRPKVEKPRELVVSFRVSVEEYRRLQGAALRRGQSIGECARRLVGEALEKGEAVKR